MAEIKTFSEGGVCRQNSFANLARRERLARLLRNANCMTFALLIGETEKNLLEFSFNQLLGSTEIRVNEKVVKKTTRLFSEPLQERHEFEVGQNERHTVFIEKQRKLLFGQKYLVYVNQRLVKLFHGF